MPLGLQVAGASQHRSCCPVGMMLPESVSPAVIAGQPKPQSLEEWHLSHTEAVELPKAGGMGLKELARCGKARPSRSSSIADLTMQFRKRVY